MKTIKSVFVVLFLIWGFVPDVRASQAQEALEVSLDSVLAIAKDEALSEEERRGFVFDEIDKIFSFYHTARLSVGREWNRFSEVEQNEFVRVFSHLLFDTYYKRVTLSKAVKTTKVDFLKQRDLGKNRVELLTLTSGKNGEIPINYRMVETDKGWRVYDILVEGISLVSNYRSQFSEVLIKKDPARLIAIIKEKNESTKDND